MGVRQSEEILSVGIHDTQYIDEVQQYFEKYLSTPKKNPRIKDGGCPFLSIKKDKFFTCPCSTQYDERFHCRYQLLPQEKGTKRTHNLCEMAQTYKTPSYKKC